MITIAYPNKDKVIEDWKSQLEELVTAHKLVEDVTLEVPVLKDSSTVLKGEQAINDYMNSLMEFKEVWFACSCG